jgi:hypothetical protein
MKDVTDRLSSGDAIPDHPARSNALKILSIDEVRDAENGALLTSGLDGTTAAVLQSGQGDHLNHLYRYVIREVNGVKRIYHTRPNPVILQVTVEEPTDQA